MLQDWGQKWIWDDLQFVGDDDWLEKAIMDEFLVAVTDGSYIKDVYPDLCSQWHTSWNAQKEEVDWLAPFQSIPLRPMPIEESCSGLWLFIFSF